MELKYQFLQSQEAKTALNKLFGAEFDGKTAYNIRRIHYLCELNFKSLKNEFQSLVKKHSELDERGNVIELDGPGSFKIKEGQTAEWHKDVRMLMEKTFPLERCEKIPVSAILSSPTLKLSSFDLEALEPVLDGLELI